MKLSYKKALLSKKLSLNTLIMLGDIKSVRVLIKKGVDVNKPGKKMWTPLHVAAKHGHSEIVKLLIQNGASVNSVITESKGQRFTPLYLAVLKNHLECAKVLLKNGASVSPTTDGATHPIQIAVFKGHEEMAALLLSHGAQVNVRFSDSFFKAFKNQTFSNLWMGHNIPLLHGSILQQFDGMTQLLLQYGADINLTTSLGKTTLMQAVEVNNDRLVKFLIENGANVNERDVFGQPVLHFTIINANRRISMYSKEENSRQKQKMEIVKLLINSGADVEARFPADKSHSSVLHYMVMFGFHCGVEFLLNKVDCNPAEIDLRTVFSGKLKSNSVTSDIVGNASYINELEDNFESITYSIVQWAITRDMIGLPVNKAIILKHPIHRWISLENYTEEIESFRKRITDQVEFLTQFRIGEGNVTFLKLLTGKVDELVKLLNNRTVNYFAALKENESRILNYYDLVKRRLCVAERRRILLKKSTEVMFLLLMTKLPYDCCQKIVCYFSDRELEAFVDSCIDRNRKIRRKITSNHEGDTDRLKSLATLRER
ncbi:ankyrin-1-like [Cotesia glomerata]|uniref:ankyrin-1-like n=1 Tax=Cotesia glomerata TaxID=32391 RepID=UPI001D00F757|nr:ankyrin-1-like [Cotesia glomerata]